MSITSNPNWKRVFLVLKPSVPNEKDVKNVFCLAEFKKRKAEFVGTKRQSYRIREVLDPKCQP